MNSYIDLHMHSIYSDDGQYTPTKLVEMCHDVGVKIMSIADHNSVKANEEAMTKAKELGIQYIPSIEIDCTFKGVNLHVLGLGIDYKANVFKEIEENVIKQELACSNEKIILTNKLGFNVTKEELDSLSDNGIYTGEMFAEILLNKEEYKDHELLKPYREGGNRSDNPYVNFYWDYYAQGKPCYTQIQYPSLEETIEIIKSNGGKAILAHPGNNLKGKYELFDEMITIGLQGVEAYSSYHTSQTNEYFYHKAKEYNVLFTCGSDFHGKTKPSISLGGNGCLEPKEIEDLLIEYHIV